MIKIKRTKRQENLSFGTPKLSHTLADDLMLNLRLLTLLGLTKENTISLSNRFEIISLKKSFLTDSTLDDLVIRSNLHKRL